MKRTARRRTTADVMARDEQGRKECARCLTWRAIGEFTRSTSAPDGLQGRCSPCRRAHYLANAEAVRDTMREVRFGLTRQAFDAMLASQDYRCAICRTPDPGYQFWTVDHDHACCPPLEGRTVRTCGRCVRGILCSRCNKALGYAGDDVKILLAMVTYLEGR